MIRPAHPSMRKRIIGVGVAAAVALCAMAALAAAATAVKAPTGAGDMQVVRVGQLISVDPATGRLRPISPDVARSLLGTVAPLTRVAPVNVVQAANGMLKAELNDDYMENMVLRVLPDGRLVTECVQGTDALYQLMNADLPPLPAKSATVPAAAKTKATTTKLVHKNTTKR